MAYGTYIHKDLWNQPKIETRNQAVISPAGFWDGSFHEFNHLNIQEHVKHSWYADVPAAHPWDEPLPTPMPSQNLEHTNFNEKYSWSKAPRYSGSPAEVGPLARVIMTGNPANAKHQYQDTLFLDVISKLGPSVFTRALARLHETARLYISIDEWLRQIDLNAEFYIKPTEKDGKGFGCTEAARGALAHWIEIEDGVIKNYQVMAPTTWNVGPNDEKGNPGPIEAALEGIEIEDPHDPVEVGLVARSFDSCLVCTVHAHDAKNGKQLAKFKL